jgi:hypothetical protein
MRAFEVYLNEKKLCLAGVGDDGVLSAMVNWVARGGQGDLFMDVGGLLTHTELHVEWIKQRRLQVGDTVLVKVVETSSVDEPIEKHRSQAAIDRNA